MSENLVLQTEEVRVDEVEERASNQLLFFRKMHEMRKIIATKELPTDGYNEHQKYEYTSAKNYKQVLDETCMEVGMEYYTVTEKVETITLPNDASKQHLTRLYVTVILIDIDTGFSVGFPIITDGCDALDKGIYKAYTMIAKVFVQTTFLRHDKNEMDVESASTKKAPVQFNNSATRKEKAKAITTAVEPASEEMMDKIYEAVVKVREANPDFMQEGELDAFNEGKLSQVDAMALLLNIEEVSETLGVEL